jgi:hypothetical protein
VSDLTLISKVSNEAINENLKKRFENGEIYVRNIPESYHAKGGSLTTVLITEFRLILDMCWSPLIRFETVSEIRSLPDVKLTRRSGYLYRSCPRYI